MSNITEQEMQKLAEEKYGNRTYVFAGQRDGFIAGYKAALQNKVSDPATPELDKERDIKEAERLWNIPNKLEAVKLIIKWGYSLKDAKAYCENNFNREVSDVRVEEESEYSLLLTVKNELLEADKLPFSERVKANREILNFVSIKRKSAVNERKDNVGVNDAIEFAEWLSIEDEMPPLETVVLLWIPNEISGLRTLGVRYWNDGVSWASGDKKIHGTPTHWMPLPAPPESQPQQKEVEEDVCPECGCKECCCM